MANFIESPSAFQEAPAAWSPLASWPFFGDDVNIISPPTQQAIHPLLLSVFPSFFCIFLLTPVVAVAWLLALI